MSSIKETIRQEIERRRNISLEIFEKNSDTYFQGKAIAYHGLLTFINSLPDEEPSKDLEEAANEYAGVNYDCETETDAFYHHVQKEAFIAGVKWQKKQMMKEAVGAKVWESKHGVRDLEMDSWRAYLKAFEGFKKGERVKMIIVKEDEG